LKKTFAVVLALVAGMAMAQAPPCQVDQQIGMTASSAPSSTSEKSSIGMTALAAGQEASKTAGSLTTFGKGDMDAIVATATTHGGVSGTGDVYVSYGYGAGIAIMLGKSRMKVLDGKQGAPPGMMKAMLYIAPGIVDKPTLRT
jgi:hypothetical protein